MQYKWKIKSLKEIKYEMTWKKEIKNAKNEKSKRIKRIRGKGVHHWKHWYG